MKITLYVDVVSPFAYVAYHVLRVSAPTCTPRPSHVRRRGHVTAKHRTSLTGGSQQHDPIFQKCRITYMPIFLGGVMKAAGNTPPINIKSA